MLILLFSHSNINNSSFLSSTYVCDIEIVPPSLKHEYYEYSLRNISQSLLLGYGHDYFFIEPLINFYSFRGILLYRIQKTIKMGL